MPVSGDAPTTGERIARRRTRRGMTQEVLAGLVGRTADWLSKVENNRIDIDRLSVLKALASALDLTLGELIGESSLAGAASANARRTVAELRDSLLDYHQLTPFLSTGPAEPPQDLDVLRRAVGGLWEAYQASRYGELLRQLPVVLRQVQSAVHLRAGTERNIAQAFVGLTFQVAALILTKLGEPNLAWIAAERGLTAAHLSGNRTIVGSVLRTVTHALVATGRFDTAKQLTEAAAVELRPGLRNATAEYLSVYGMVFLAGAVAAARDGDRDATRSFLHEADATARRLGRDGNFLWTAFGPTNVAIHRVCTALDLGDVQVALSTGPVLDTTGLPAERRVRHLLETARAYDRWNRIDDALGALLDGEVIAPEQVRHHAISR